jgi:hypothetical protein
LSVQNEWKTCIWRHLECDARVVTLWKQNECMDLNRYAKIITK